ncbi:MAG: hypothetical protein WCD79_07195 [Chthoniobacteraceae bacterium]
MRHKTFLSLFVICVFAATAHGQKESTQEFKTDYGFTVRLTDDWREVPAGVLKQLDQKMTELVHAPQNWEYAYQLKSANHWLAYPYILIQFLPGRKSENAVKKEFEAKNELQAGFDKASDASGSLISGAKLGDYSFDPNTHTVEFVSESNIQGMGTITGYTALKLTEKGGIQFCGYCAEVDKAEFIPFFKNAVNNLQLSEGMAYKPGLLDDVPFLGSINWNSVIIGGAVGGLFGLLRTLFGKKKT